MFARTARDYFIVADHTHSWFRVSATPFGRFTLSPSPTTSSQPASLATCQIDLPTYTWQFKSFGACALMSWCQQGTDAVRKLIQLIQINCLLWRFRCAAACPQSVLANPRASHTDTDNCHTTKWRSLIKCQYGTCLWLCSAGSTDQRGRRDDMEPGTPRRACGLYLPICW